MVNIKEIGEFIAATNRVNRAWSVLIVGQVFDYIKESLASGQEVSIDKFGKFMVDERSERMGRNPRDGTPMTISARTVVKFKPQKSLREEVNTKEGS